MTIQTRDFGSMELDESEVLKFSVPIFGFDDLDQFVLLSDDEAGPGLLWLQSVQDPATCFILLDPDTIGLDYTPQVPAEAAKQLAAQEGDSLVVRLIAVVPEDFRETTVNLKSPVVINPAKRTAAQVILEADYPIRMRLFDGEDAAC
ncbi:flagellar assembly protein FliW [Ruminococcaceae bacterium OttesenSCG-928-D13]|nr:flagellar assembly protein FliW [Ruminococcaceae bacterium OttesenSCG-928-D13]